MNHVPDINYLAVALATVAAMAIGFVFYHPKVLDTRWARAAGHTEGSIKAPKPWVYPLLIVCAFLTAWVLAGAGFLSWTFYGGSFLMNVLITAWMLFIGLTAARFLVHNVFEPAGLKPTGYTLLNEFLILTVMGLLIGALAPANLDAVRDFGYVVGDWMAYAPLAAGHELTIVPLFNYLAITLATIAAMVIGFVFYMPGVFGKGWAKAVGYDGVPMKQPSAWVYPMLVACAFVTAWVLAGAGFISWAFYGGSFFWNVLLTGWILFVGFTATRFLVHNAFEAAGLKPSGYTLLNEFITITAMCAIIGAMPPAFYGGV